MSEIAVFDTTLRDGEQSPGASMTPSEKLRMAHEIDGLGVQVIEAGFAEEPFRQFVHGGAGVVVGRGQAPLGDLGGQRSSLFNRQSIQREVLGFEFEG